MSYDLRTIALLSEVIFPPIQLRPQVVQSIHNQLYADPRFAYQNFAVTNEGILLSNPPQRPAFVSSLNFLPDRVQLREELTAVTLDDFKARLTTVVGLAQERLAIPTAAATQCVVRSLVNPRCFSDSRDFLARGMARFDSAALASFGRPASSLGLKFLFPQTIETGNFFAVRVESFNEDPRSLFLENVGTFTQTPLPDGIPRLADQMQHTYDFVLGPTCEFIARFDTPSKG